MGSNGFTQLEYNPANRNNPIVQVALLVPMDIGIYSSLHRAIWTWQFV
jgi:hypothetical protein